MYTGEFGVRYITSHVVAAEIHSRVLTTVIASITQNPLDMRTTQVKALLLEHIHAVIRNA